MNFTTEDVYHEVVRLSEEFPDFIYNNQPDREYDDLCGYTGHTVGSEEGKACIVGQALMNLGVPSEYLIWNSSPADIVLYDLIGFFDDDDKYPMLIRAIQNGQDTGNTWAESVRDAHENF